MPSKATTLSVEEAISPIELESLLAHIIRVPDVFMEARPHLKPEHFYHGTEAHFRLLWEITLKLEKIHKASFLSNPDGAIAFQTFWEEVAAACYNEPELLTDNQKHFLFGSVDTVNDPGYIRLLFGPYAFHIKMAKHRLRKFLLERLVQDEMRRTLKKVGNNVIADPSTFLERLNRTAVSLNHVGQIQVAVAMPLGWKPKKVRRVSTNIGWLDSVLNGGHVAGELHGVLGGYGSGKTCFSVQLLVGSSIAYQKLAESETKELGSRQYPDDCYLFHYEATLEEIRVRMLSSTAIVLHEHISNKSFEELSTSANGYDSLHSYEKQYFKDNYSMDGDFEGEQERITSYSNLLRTNTWCMDMSGDPENPKVGTGGIPEIRRIIENHQRQMNEQDAFDAVVAKAAGKEPGDPGYRTEPHKVGCIIIDYAGICVQRYMSEHGKGNDELRVELGSFGRNARTELALAFNAPIWIMHQLSAASNSKNSHARAHMTDAAEAKNFAENLHFCYALGTKDLDNNNLLFVCSKARRAQIQSPIVLVMEGKLYRLSVSGTHVWDKISHMMVTKEVCAGKIGGQVVGHIPTEDPMASPEVVPTGALPSTVEAQSEDLAQENLPEPDSAPLDQPETSTAHNPDYLG